MNNTQTTTTTVATSLIPTQSATRRSAKLEKIKEIAVKASIAAIGSILVAVGQACIDNKG